LLKRSRLSHAPENHRSDLFLAVKDSAIEKKKGPVRFRKKQETQ
jgi:hypothetical protein